MTRNFLLPFVLLLSGAPAFAADWPMWKYDAGRTASTPHRLATPLYPQWVLSLPTARPAWRDESNKNLFFDYAYEPVVAGTTMLVGSMNSDSVTAYDTRSGDTKWRFYAEGPVRFAPATSKGKAYVGSDDGHLYCLNIDDGSVAWKLRGGPGDDRILGNGRLVSRWPVRGGPAVLDGKVYFAAGIWPCEGTFIYCVDAASGAILWCNSGSGAAWISQQHGPGSFAGVGPQGYVAVGADKVMVPSGRSVPGAYDRVTGRFLYYHASSRQFGKDPGGFAVSVQGDVFINHGEMYQLADGKGLTSVPDGVCAEDALYVTREDRLVKCAYTKDNKISEQSLGASVGPARIKCGNALYCARGGDIAAVELSGTPKVTWRHTLPSDVWSLIAADQRLFVSTVDGAIHCFGASRVAPRRHAVADAQTEPRLPAASGDVRQMLAAAGDAGYAVIVGLDDGRAVEELVGATKMHAVAIEPDAGKVERFRKRMDALGLYGDRVAVIACDLERAGLPPYLARLLLVQDPAALDPDAVERLCRSLRPYGGVAFFKGTGAGVQRASGKGELAGALVKRSGGYVTLTRPGPLAGSAPWTHQYADARNSVTSREARVKLPLALLWFGGPTNDLILPRHGHGPSPQVAGGRLFIEGENLFRCTDVYTGRLLWERKIEKIGYYYRHTGHHPGANEIGSNYVSLPDAVYLISPRTCMVLDPATGKTRKEFRLPSGRPETPPHWGFVNVYDDYLIAASVPVSVPQPEKKSKKRGEPDDGKDAGGSKDRYLRLVDVPGVSDNSEYASGSRELCVMDRASGRVLWSRSAAFSFRHNTIVADDGRLFVIDGIAPDPMSHLRLKGFQPNGTPTLYALDVKTGKILWKTEQDVFGTFLNISADHALLVQAGSSFRDRAWDEVGKGIVVYKAADGTVVWKDLSRTYSGPLMLHGDTFITNGSSGTAFNLLTGGAAGWTWSRQYGCNTAIACANLLTFRSGAAGFYDVAGKSGTGNFGGFKSGCTSNLIPADGVLNAPDYTRTCKCSYQNQASLAFVHDPRAEVWTFGGKTDDARVGINLGAPGDRRADDGTLWSDFPSVGGASVGRSVNVSGGATFRHHARLFEGELPWVGASGVTGASRVEVKLAPGTYRVRLVFAEPDVGAQAGSRVFSVSAAGGSPMTVDIAGAAKRPRTVIIRELRGVEVSESLAIDLKPQKGETLLCGIEAVRQ